MYTYVVRASRLAYNGDKDKSRERLNVYSCNRISTVYSYPTFSTHLIYIVPRYESTHILYCKVYFENDTYVSN